MALPPFHMAAPIVDKEQTRDFYCDLLGCTVGREADKWIDFDFFGHQLSLHVNPAACKALTGADGHSSSVDGKSVPVRHFGAILPWADWQDLSARLTAANTDFIINPYIRFEGSVGEQATMFFLDPSGNALEFKAFKDTSQVFAH